MSVEIEPAELGFRRPFTAEVAETLTIKNPTSAPVAFKVKTTAPKQYCVRPNSGRIEPGREVEVTVLLQAMKQDPPPDAKCRDKFLVQSVPITVDKEFISIHDLWDAVDKADVRETKIRVAFLPAEDPDAVPAAATTPARPIATNGVGATPDGPAQAYASPREESRGLNGALSAADKGTAAPVTPARSLSSAKSAPAPAPAPAAPTVPAAAAEPAPAKAAATTPTTPGTDKDATIAALTARLAEAEALISSLRKDGGLRQRRGAGGASEKAGDAGAGATATATALETSPAVRQGTEGVPVQLTAILCLLCFLLAYFFF